MVNKVAGKIREKLNNVRFFAVGISKRGGLFSLIEDLRSQNLTDTTEKEWCGIYAKSNIVIGIHGSNMLIPTALAAGFIELMPRHKIPNITEDLTLQQHNAYSLFLGRHLDHYAPASLIALHAVSMVRDFPSLYENTEKNKKAI